MAMTKEANPRRSKGREACWFVRRRRVLSPVRLELEVAFDNGVTPCLRS